ncbi:hypothetical protein DNHGIG_23910 [Collibacillus ludicampi]|uniref:Phage tail tape measure protein domain-containing protein n=1 Tax=Collibacillus ludicampi TaxID=2771369 RepID=A0AAV4LHD5_9BACL|nr:phage tail tape measure protein [Collibacillus ludicampi]GIM46842.1 hypothetical protein DNHGIG_23910 [Collibacillus ludicampi]
MAASAYSLEIMIRAVDQFTAPIRAMQSQISTFQRSISETTKQVEQLSKRFSQIGKVPFGGGGLTSETTKQVDQLSKRLTDINRLAAGSGLLFGGSMLANAMAENVKQAGDFLTTLTMIQDTVGATADQIKQIQNVIQQTSGKTIFSVQDTAEIAKRLSSSGLDAQQITQTLPIFTQYAEVQKLGKGTSPDEAVTQAISSAHMVGAYTPKELLSFLDKYNKATFMTPGSSSEFADTFKYLAPSMQALHASTDDTLLLAALSNRLGILGSMAGTNASDMILRSISGLFGGRGKTPSAQMRGLHALGLDNTIFDKSGNFLGVANLVAQLQRASQGRSPTELAKYYKDIFGMQGLRIAQLLSSERGQDALQSIVKQMQNMKSISQMQEDTNKSPLGQIQQLQTNLQNLKLNVFIQMAQLLNPILQYLNQIVSKIQVFADQHPKIMKYVAAFVAITGGLLALSAAVAGVIVLFGTLGVGGLAAVGVITAFAVVATLIIKYWGPIKSFFVNLWNGVKSTTQSAWQAIWGAIGPAVMSIWRTIFSACTQIIAFWRTIWPMLKQIIMFVWPAIKDYIAFQLLSGQLEPLYGQR